MNGNLKESLSDYFKQMVENQIELERYFRMHDFSLKEFEPSNDEEFAIRKILIDTKESIELIKAIYEN